MRRENASLLARNWQAESAFAAAWLFIVLAGTFDGYFAWHFRADFQDWEINPSARWLAGAGGMGMLLGFKAASMLFAVLVAVACRHFRHRLAMPMTMIIVGVYVLLSLHYVTGFLGMPNAAQLPQEILALAKR